jgi:uncharacterized integral membrane protein
MEMKLNYVLAITISVALTIFVLQNTQPIIVKLLFWETEVSLILLMIILLLAGFVAGAAFVRIRRRMKRRPDRNPVE